MTFPIDSAFGIYERDQLREAIRPPSRYFPESHLVAVEQTANLGGGTVWPLEKLSAVAEVTKEAGLATHMDGARLLNAAVKFGIDAKQFTAGYDLCWLDFSKGLGTPMGAMLAGSEEFI